MHHGTCVTHVPWCMSGSLTCGGGENVPGIPGACAPAILRIWQEAHCTRVFKAWFVDMRYTDLPGVFWPVHTSVLHCLLASGWFWRPTVYENPNHNIHETCLCGQKWSNQGTCLESENKSSNSLTYLCSGDVQTAGVLSGLVRVISSVAHGVWVP